MESGPMTLHHSHLPLNRRSSKDINQSPIRRFRRFPQIIQTGKGIRESRSRFLPLDAITVGGV